MKKYLIIIKIIIKMKFRYALTGVILMAAMLSCQKDGVKKNNNVAVNSARAEGYSVSKDDYETFTKAIRRGDGNLSQLFSGIAQKQQKSGTKIGSLQPTHITTYDVGDDDLPYGEEEVQTAIYFGPSSPYESYLEDPWSGQYDGIPAYTYRGVVAGWTQFTKRNTNLNINVFYKYQYNFDNNQPAALWKDDQHPIPGVTLSGGNIGDLSDLQNASINIPQQTGPGNITGNATGWFNETRTILYCSSGTFKLTASSAAVGINIGGEISAGITVTRKENSIMHYDWTADLSWVLSNYRGSNYSYTPTAYMTVWGKSYGLQRD